MRSRYCTCGGTAPGYPMHEDYCMIYTGRDFTTDDEEDLEYLNQFEEAEEDREGEE